MTNDRIKIILISSVTIFTLISIFVVLDSLGVLNRKPSYNKDNLYTFNCYNKNKMIMSSYGFGYKNGKIFDSREQKIITLPEDCAVFRFEE